MSTRADARPFSNQRANAMLPLRSCHSFLFALIAGATFLAGCSAEDPYAVYTHDERRADVAPVARGEVSFPVLVGTNVPDANGNAKALTKTMRGIRVRFVDITVDGTCDSDVGGEGEFYYQLGINDRDVARRPQDRWYSAKLGESIGVDASRVFFVEPDDTFSVQLSVSEEDDFLNGGDDQVGSRHLPYTARDIDYSSKWNSVELGSGDCAVSVTYVLERVQ
jgi:hypothetical protein